MKHLFNFCSEKVCKTKGIHKLSCDIMCFHGLSCLIMSWNALHKLSCDIMCCFGFSWLSSHLFETFCLSSQPLWLSSQPPFQPSPPTKPFLSWLSSHQAKRMALQPSNLHTFKPNPQFQKHFFHHSSVPLPSLRPLAIQPAKTLRDTSLSQFQARCQILFISSFSESSPWTWATIFSKKKVPFFLLPLRILWHTCASEKIFAGYISSLHIPGTS